MKTTMYPGLSELTQHTGRVAWGVKGKLVNNRRNVNEDQVLNDAMESVILKYGDNIAF